LSLFRCCAALRCSAAAIAIAGAVRLPIVAVLFAKEELAVIAMEVGSVLAYNRLLPQILKTGNNNINKIISLSLSLSLSRSLWLCVCVCGSFFHSCWLSFFAVCLSLLFCVFSSDFVRELEVQAAVL
jgi:hypothetical protein